MKISAVIPAFNSEATIERALNSVFSQTRPADEVIVIDDGSKDATAEKVKAFGERVRLVKQSNAGVSVARNNGIKAAAGDWIAFLDADDQWLPEKLQLQTEHLGRCPDLKWTYGNFLQIDGSGVQSSPAHPKAKIQPLLNDREIFNDYFCAYTNHAYAWTSTILVNKSVFDSAGCFEPGMKRAQDNDLWFRIAYQFPKVGYLVSPLAIYHMDTPSSSTKVNDSVEFMIYLVNRHEVMSKQFNRYEAFRPCITHMLQTWTRQLISQARVEDAKLLLARYPQYLSYGFRKEMIIRMYSPKAVNAAIDFYFSLKNKALGR